jgi:hypothetical protein
MGSTSRSVNAQTNAGPDPVRTCAEVVKVWSELAHLIFKRREGADVVNAPLFVERRHRLSSNDLSAGGSH